METQLHAWLCQIYIFRLDLANSATVCCSASKSPTLLLHIRSNLYLQLSISVDWYNHETLISALRAHNFLYYHRHQNTIKLIWLISSQLSHSSPLFIKHRRLLCIKHKVSWPALQSAARLIGHIPKYAPVSGYTPDILHWLPVSHKIAAHVWWCLTVRVLCILLWPIKLCRLVSDLGSHRALFSLARGELLVPKSTLCCNQAFSPPI